MVLMSREGIRLSHRVTRSMMQSEIEARQVERPPRLSSVQPLRGHEVLQISMICSDFELLRRSFKEVSPLVQGPNDSEHFLVMNFVVAFHGVQTL